MTAVSPISTTGTTSSSTVSTAIDNTEIASNFTTFLQLLTTQLKNQNPLDPLDTNQFTQQLVQFAQVEQQMKSNDQLSRLVSLEKSAQASTALAYVGSTVVVDGSTAALTNGSATWNFNVTKPSTATITIKDCNRPVRLYRHHWRQPGHCRRSHGMAAAMTAASGRTAATRSPPRPWTPASSRSPYRPRSRPIVDSVDLTQDPPVLSINGQNYTLDKIKRVIRSAS